MAFKSPARKSSSTRDTSSPCNRRGVATAQLAGWHDAYGLQRHFNVDALATEIGGERLFGGRYYVLVRAVW